jgi:hypothetical protein
MSPIAKAVAKRKQGRPKGSKNATSRPEGAVVPTLVTVPVSHFRMLETEAEIYQAKRAQFLEMLLRRELGELPFERPKSAPRYTFMERELTQNKKYIWYMRKDSKAKLDDLRMRLGNLGVSTWIVLALNAWVGWPAGIPKEAVKK